MLGKAMNPRLAFLTEIQEVKAEIKDSNSDIPPLSESVPFSPQAYDAISVPILESLIDCTQQIGTLLVDAPYQLNLGIILYKELLMEVCDHYFKEYERINNFIDVRPTPGAIRVKISGFVRSPMQRALDKLRRISIPVLHSIKNRILPRTAPRIGWAGTTSFPWYELGKQLFDFAILSNPVKIDTPVKFPLYNAQLGILRQWVAHINLKMIDLFQVDDDTLRPFDFSGIDSLLVQMSSVQVVGNEKLDFLITGTLGIMQTRLVALHAQSRGIPIMTLHHGSHHNIFAEPRLYLYEDILPDALVDYGSVEEQRAGGYFGRTKNLSGRSIQFFSRSDSYVQSKYQGGKIDSAASLTGRKIVFLASSGWEQKRFGPHRDVHPSTYLAWQEQLLIWLEKQSKCQPYLRPHPKRVTTRYDVDGYQLLEGNLGEVIDFAEVFVIDRLSTSLSYIAATNKPILFFDPLLLRTFPQVLEDIRGRCHYAQVDIMAPEEGFARMEADLSRSCKHTFVPKYCLTENAGQSEVSAVAEAVAQAVFLEG